MTRPRFVIALFFLAVTACGSTKSDTTPGDASTFDVSLFAEAGVVRDASPLTDASAVADASAEVDARATMDASPEANADGAAISPDATLATPQPGQCYLDSHCGGGMLCVASTPGGFCSGCDGTCSVGPADECSFSTCHQTCESTSECSAGLRCNTSSGICALKSCISDAECGDFHSCQDGFCRRMPCADGCPGGTTCRATSDGSLCVEDFLTFD